MSEVLNTKTSAYNFDMIKSTLDVDFKASVLKNFLAKRNKKLLPDSKGIAEGILQQKFLFFYNLFSYVQGKPYTFLALKAFENGPVYNDIRIMAKNGIAFENIKDIAEVEIDKDVFAQTMTLVELFNDKLSEFSHKFDLWKNIKDTYDNNAITEKSITEDDMKWIELFLEEINNINNNYRKELSTSGKIILIHKDDHKEVMSKFKPQVDAYRAENAGPVYANLIEGELFFA